MIPKHYTAWMTNDPSCLDQANMDVTILEDELVGEDPDGRNAWASNGPRVFYAITDVDAKDGDAQDGINEAIDLMAAAGWEVVGPWQDTPNSYIATVAQA